LYCTKPNHTSTLEQLMHPTHDINRYLFHEFGFDIDREGYPVDDACVTDRWPFVLQYVGTIRHSDLLQTVFTFRSGPTPYFVLWGTHATSYPCAGMSFQDVERQVQGSTWIHQQDPISLATSRIGDPTVPPTMIRRAAIESLVAHARNHLFHVRILEGLFLRQSQHYLALVEDEAVHETVVLGTAIPAQVVGFPEAAAWRRLAVHVGELLALGHLTDDTAHPS
jgi:hypothetical protein